MSLKIKCSFLDYIQLLMINQVIWATNGNQNTKKNWKRPPMSLKNKMFIFGLHSTSDDWPSDQSDECQMKCKKKQTKRSPLSLKNKILIFGLCSTSHDKPSNLSDKRRLKHKKNERRPLCHQKIKCSFLDYVQLLMIGRAIWAMNVNWNAKIWKKAPLCHWKIKSLFLDYVQLLMIGWAIWAMNVNLNAKKWKKALYVIEK